jgi:hypothetical protein
MEKASSSRRLEITQNKNVNEGFFMFTFTFRRSPSSPQQIVLLKMDLCNFGLSEGHVEVIYNLMKLGGSRGNIP